MRGSQQLSIASALVPEKTGELFLTDLMRRDAYWFYLHQIYWWKKQARWTITDTLSGYVRADQDVDQYRDPDRTARILIDRYGEYPKVVACDRTRIWAMDYLTSRGYASTDRFYAAEDGMFLLCSPADGMLIRFRQYAWQFQLPERDLAKKYLTTIRNHL